MYDADIEARSAWVCEDHWLIDWIPVSDRQTDRRTDGRAELAHYVFKALYNLQL